MKSLSILVIDDEPAIRLVLVTALARAGHTVEEADNAEHALERLAKGDIEVAICDIKMPGVDGIEMLKRAQALRVNTTFIMITAFASMETVVAAMRAGAYDYITKPIRFEELQYRLEQIADLRGLQDENITLRKIVMAESNDTFRFSSPVMQEVERLIAKVAPTNSTVLITGESGTGKGVIARMLHNQSNRANETFLPVNCGAIPDNLMESEFFGHAKGAFTGADRATKGLFVQADRGTIFLDEIGELPPALQAKLLHVIEDMQVRPVGSEQSRRVDVRIIAATNRNLQDMVSQGIFREDFYFRLGMFHIDSPPLRERKSDMHALMRYILDKCARKHGLNQTFLIDPEAEELLTAYDWPGNIRQMEHFIMRACILADGGRIRVVDLPSEMTRILPNGNASESGHSNNAGSLREILQRYEIEIINRTLSEVAGDRRSAAQRLGIGLSSLYRKIEEFEAAGLKGGG